MEGIHTAGSGRIRSGAGSPGVALAVVAVLTLFPASAHPCTCEPFASVQEEVDHRDVVFSGRALDVQERWDDRPSGFKVRFQVTGVWKEEVPAEVTVYTSVPDAACGYEGFRLCADYLVYGAWLSDEGARNMLDLPEGEGPEEPSVFTHTCTRTQRLADATADLAELGAPVSGTPTPGTGTCGTVEQLVGAFEVSPRPPDYWSMDRIRFRADGTAEFNTTQSYPGFPPQYPVAFVEVFHYEKAGSAVKAGEWYDRVALTFLRGAWIHPDTGQWMYYDGQPEIAKDVEAAAVSADGQRVLLGGWEWRDLVYTRTDQPVYELLGDGVTAVPASTWAEVKTAH